MVFCFRNAAEEAGFNVLRLIHEPSAALLAYGIGQDSPSGKRQVLMNLVSKRNMDDSIRSFLEMHFRSFIDMKLHKASIF